MEHIRSIPDSTDSFATEEFPAYWWVVIDRNFEIIALKRSQFSFCPCSFCTQVHGYVLPTWQNRHRTSRAPPCSTMNLSRSNWPITKANIWFCSSIHWICEFTICLHLTMTEFLIASNATNPSRWFSSTFVCPTEIIAFSDRIGDFKALNTEVVGVSVDSEFSHLAWCNQSRKVTVWFTWYLPSYFWVELIYMFFL